MTRYARSTEEAISHIVAQYKDADPQDADDQLRANVGDYVNCNMMPSEYLQACEDLADKYGSSVDIGTLHRWGSARTLSADLAEFAASLAIALIERAAYARIHGKG